MLSEKFSTKKKLLHIAFVSGGVDVAIRLINKHLDPNKYEIYIIREQNRENIYNKNQELIPTIVIPVGREISLKDLFYFFKILIAVKKIKPDIVHLHSAKAGILGRGITFLLGLKTFYTPHAFSYLSANNKIKRKIYLIFEQIARLIFYNSRIIACSNSESDRAIKEVGFKPQNVFIYNNSIPEIVIKMDDLSMEIDLNQRFLCTIGRPSYQKNLNVMIQMVHDLHTKGYKERLIILGVGNYAPNLKEVVSLIKKYELENYITLIPWISREEVLTILSKSEIYISTSRYEGLPLSIIEAMALGIPVVASNVDGNKDLIENGINGYLIDNFSVKDYSDKIIEILNNKVIKENFSMQQQNIFSKNYQSTLNISTLEKYYLI